MGRLIDADELLTHIEDYGEGQSRLDLIDPYYVRNASTVEAIPKADYKARLKADMVAMLEGVDLQFDKISFCRKGEWKTVPEIKAEYKAVIQQKINALKAEIEPQEGSNKE